MSHEVRTGEIVIEIDEEQESRYSRPEEKALLQDGERKMVDTVVRSGNRHASFFPVEAVLRSRIEIFRETIDYIDKDAMRVSKDPIPGARIHIDLDEKKGRITDALLDPENRELRRFLELEAERRPMPIRLCYCPDVETDLSNPFTLWNWIYWTRRIVDGDKEHWNRDESRPWGKACGLKGPRYCRPVQNLDRLPTIEQCIKTGYVNLRINDQQPGLVQKIIEDSRQATNEDYRKHPRVGVMTPFLAGTATAET